MLSPIANCAARNEVEEIEREKCAHAKFVHDAVVAVDVAGGVLDLVDVRDRLELLHRQVAIGDRLGRRIVLCFEAAKQTVSAVQKGKPRTDLRTERSRFSGK